MMRQFLVVSGALLGLSASVLWGGDARQIQLPWSDLALRIESRRVALVLPGGTEIKGKVEAVEAQGLRLRVTKTSDRKVMPKGPRLIPRESISVLRVTEYRFIARPLLALGAAGVIAAGLASLDDNGEGPVVILRPVGAAAGGILGGVGGYYAGKALDKKVTEIHVIRGEP